MKKIYIIKKIQVAVTAENEKEAFKKAKQQFKDLIDMENKPRKNRIEERQ